MRIDGDTLIIDEELSNESAPELLSTLDSENISTIKIENDNIASSVIQILLCKIKTVKIETNSKFLDKIFKNVSIE